MQKVGILHPGQMGSSVAASALKGGCQVYWASEGRSPETHARAERLGLEDASSLAQLCATCAIVVSVCPPHAAETVASQVAGCGFGGLYLDANAISPQRVVRIGQIVGRAGAAFVDGGIVGPPAWEPGTTWLYLSGMEAQAAADCFAAGPLQAVILGGEPGQASALKMCYAAWTKGSTALLAAIVATAEALEVWPALRQQWEWNWPGFPGQTEERVRRVTAKAWRFAGEMEEIAATLEAAGLPAGFHSAAADLYRRLAHFKGAPETPPLEEVLDALQQAAAGQ